MKNIDGYYKLFIQKKRTHQHIDSGYFSWLCGKRIIFIMRSFSTTFMSTAYFLYKWWIIHIILKCPSLISLYAIFHSSRIIYFAQLQALFVANAMQSSYHNNSMVKLTTQSSSCFLTTSNTTSIRLLNNQKGTLILTKD